MSTPFTTPQAVESLRPNVHVFPPRDLLPEALIIRATTLVAPTVEGDQPIVRAPFLTVGEAGFVPEGDEIPDGGVDSREAIIATGKVATIAEVSREQYKQTAMSNLLSTEMKRAVIVKADGAFLAQPMPAGGAITPPPGILVQDHTAGGRVVDNLDAVADAIALIEGHSGTADLIVASPASWAAVSKLKTGEGSNASLLGPPAVAAERQLLSVPVAVSASVPDDLLLIVDRRAILSAYSGVTLAVSEHAAFRRDAFVTRVTWRLGATITHPERVIELRVGEAGSGGEVEGAAARVATAKTASTASTAKK
ncbi:phage major capsid protein [Mycolicibacterium sp. 050232]|uniref:phage major capsid protein n=1 Tax=Mycolicibacterium sp. 050232 TaxID=3113982 RepID=UPI002E2A031E|nr:phage major capsid protein [Mycolicibacterium sp. 050232]MED5814487.1 phage major capsid protein [Mycolicibacterium sp. 050232]